MFLRNANLLNRLYQEFAHYYMAERCQWAPTNPRRAFNLAFEIASRRNYRPLSEEHVLTVVYATLGFRGADRPGLFQTFDPAKYNGTLPLNDHFINLFARKFSGKLSKEMSRTTDRGRKGDAEKFQTTPGLGLRNERTLPDRNRHLLDDLPEVLNCLNGRERGVIHLLYWEDLSARKIGALMGIDHKTVASVHQTAVSKMRRAYGDEENLAF